MQKNLSRKKGFLFAIGCATITLITDPGDLSTWGHPLILYLTLILVVDITILIQKYRHKIMELEQRLEELEE